MFTQNTNQPSAQQGKAAGQQTGAGDFFAQPYNHDEEGFNFSTEEEYEQKSSQCRDSFNLPVEEFYIYYVGGNIEINEIFGACRVDQSNFGQFLAIIEDVPEDQWPDLFYLCDSIGYDMGQAVAKLGDVSIFRGCLEDAAKDWFDECYLYRIPEEVQIYIDYEAFARDRQLEGEMYEFGFAGDTFTCTNANGL